MREEVDPETGRPRYNQFDSPALEGLSWVQRVQVLNAINCQLLTEIIQQAGGEVILDPGFRDRLRQQKHAVESRFLDDGSYRLKVVPVAGDALMTEIGGFTRWIRHDVAKGDQLGEVWEVIEDHHGDVYTTLRRVDESGDPMPGKPEIRVKRDYMIRGIGWRRWTPPEEDIEQMAGRDR